MPSLFIGRILYLSWLVFIAGYVATDETMTAWRNRQTRVQFTVGRATTYIEQPRRPDGVVDYLGAFNEPLKRVKPEDNAAALLMSGRYSREPFVSSDISEAYYRLLGTRSPPNTAPILWIPESYLTEFSASEAKTLKAEIERCVFRAWSAGESPKIGELVRRNEPFLAVAVEASKRKTFASPFVSTGDPPDLIGIQLPQMTVLGRAAQLLALRAMQKVGAKDVESAMKDVEAIRRFGAMLAQGERNLDEYRVAIRLLDAAALTESELLTRLPTKREWHLERIRELTSMKLPRLKEVISERERLYPLAATVHWFDYGSKVATHERHILFPAVKTSASRAFLASIVDGDSALRSVNRIFDEVAAELDEPSFPKRAAKMETLRKKYLERSKKLVARGRDWTFGWTRHHPGGIRAAIGEQFGDHFGASSITSYDPQHALEINGVIHIRLLIAAHVLKAHKLEKGSFPKTLDESKADSRLLIDPATDKPFAYKTHRNRAYLASAGPDGKPQAYLGPRPRFMQAFSTKQSDDGDDIPFSFD